MLTISNLCFRFPNRLILDGVSVGLTRRTITCLLGGNGTGKTTLFNLISGFLRPNAGSISCGGTEITGLAPFRISRLGIGRTFQDLRLIGGLSVRENILLALPPQPGERLLRALLPARFHNTCDAKTRVETDGLLAQFFLADVGGQFASEISYGQQKLLTLACCAATGASVLLLDEPAAGISPEFRERVADRLTRLKEMGKTILLIEHQPDFLERVGNQFLFLRAGRLHYFETLVELAASPIAHESLI